jgi:hypothetical protein
MDFDRKYELLEALPGKGVKSFRGRQAATGRSVCVHLLPGGHSPTNDALLARIRALRPESLMQLIEVGQHDGAIFVVTDAPPYEHLLEWLQEQERAAAERRKLSRGGAWKIPVAPPQLPDAPAPVPTTSAGSDQATRKFESSAESDLGGVAAASSTGARRQMPAIAETPEATTRQMPAAAMPSSTEATRQIPATSKTPSIAEAPTREIPVPPIPSPPAEATRQLPMASKTSTVAEVPTREMPIPPIPSFSDATRQMPVTTRVTPPPDKSGESTRVFQPAQPTDPGPATETTPQIREPERPWLHRAWRKLSGKTEQSKNS